MLSTAARVHLRKLDRLHALEIADGISVADGWRSDLITGWALRLKAARGPNATVETRDHPAIVASGLTEADVAEINQTIALLQERRISDAPPAKILRMLEACGATQTAGEEQNLAAAACVQAGLVFKAFRNSVLIWPRPTQSSFGLSCWKGGGLAYSRPRGTCTY